MNIISNILYTSFSVLASIALLSVGVLPHGVLAQSTSVNDDEGGNEWQGREEDEFNNWRSHSSALQTAIDELPDTRVEDIPIPVLFGVSPSSLTQNFGDPRGGGTRSHEGLDIMAKSGAPIGSPTTAVVIRVGEGPSSGKYVYTANPGGETFVYMHLDRIADGIDSGTLLSRGQVLGFVGNTGNASGGQAHLHFEIKKNGATDPFPRLTQEFTLSERVQSINDYLSTESQPEAEALAQFLATEYKTEFSEAISQNMSLHSEVVNNLDVISDVQASAEAMVTPVPSTSVTLPTADLTVGDTGSQVVALQQFLNTHIVGPRTSYLSLSGATGYFGPITQSALAEYQASVGISPAVGYYGPVTRMFIELQGGETLSTEAPQAIVVPVMTSSFTRDLKLGFAGEDVRDLQKYLNSHGYAVSDSGVGSAGNETTYFGRLTQTALISYQKANGITPAVGYFGPITRASVEN